MTVAAILQGKGDSVVSVQADDSVQNVVALLGKHRIGCVPVVEGHAVVGIFSERDVVTYLGRLGAAVLDQPVRQVMTSPAMTITSDTGVLTALSIMTKRRIRHLPIVDDGKMIGFVSIGDLVKYRIDRIEAEAAALRDYIQSA